MHASQPTDSSRVYALADEARHSASISLGRICMSDAFSGRVFQSDPSNWLLNFQNGKRVGDWSQFVGSTDFLKRYQRILRVTLNLYEAIWGTPSTKRTHARVLNRQSSRENKASIDRF
jgi:hypothetical protein